MTRHVLKQKKKANISLASTYGLLLYCTITDDWTYFHLKSSNSDNYEVAVVRSAPNVVIVISPLIKYLALGIGMLHKFHHLYGDLGNHVHNKFAHTQ